MDCHHIKDMLSEYADGMLAEPAAAEVAKHLAGCERCRQAHESMLKIMDHMSRLEAVPEPPDFVARVNARMDRPYSPAGWLRRLFLPLRFKLPLEAAALAAIALLIVRLWGIGGEPEMSGLTARAPIEKREAATPQPETAKKGGQSDRQAVDAAGQPADGSGQPVEAVPLTRTADENLSVTGSRPEPEPPVQEALPARPDKTPAGRLTDKDAANREDKPEITGLDVEKPPADKGRPVLKRSAAEKSLVTGSRGESLESADPPPAIRPFDTGQLQLMVPDSLPKAGDLAAIIDSLGGALVSREGAEDAAGPVSLVVEIQAARYPDLIRELGRLGVIRRSASPIPQDKLGTIRIKIVILTFGP